MVSRGGKADMRPSFRPIPPKRFSEFIGHKFDRLHKEGHFSRQSASLGNGEVLNGYLNSKLALKLNFPMLSSSHETGNTEPEEFGFLFEKIGSNEFDSRDGYFRTGPEFSSNLEDGRPDQMQPSVPVEPSAIVQQFKISSEFVIRVAHISNNVRLYRSQPIPKLWREWTAVDGVAVEFCLVNANRKLRFITIGGRINALDVNQCLIDQGIKGGPELIEKLSEFKRNVIFGDLGKLGFSDSDSPLVIYFDSHGMSFRLAESFPHVTTGFSVSYSSLDSSVAIGK